MIGTTLSVFCIVLGHAQLEGSGPCRSYKGSHLALMVEILAGALAGGAVENKGSSANWGNLIIAIDPGKLGSSPEGFCSSVTALLQRVKGARRAPGVRDITLPGERGSLHAGNSSPSALVLSCLAQGSTAIGSSQTSH